MPYEYAREFRKTRRLQPQKVYIIMVYDGQPRPYVHGVCRSREDAETTCLRLNAGFKDCGYHADFIMEIME